MRHTTLVEAHVRAILIRLKNIQMFWKKILVIIISIFAMIIILAIVIIINSS